MSFGDSNFMRNLRICSVTFSYFFDLYRNFMTILTKSTYKVKVGSGEKFAEKARKYNLYELKNSELVRLKPLNLAS